MAESYDRVYDDLVVYLPLIKILYQANHVWVTPIIYYNNIVRTRLFRKHMSCSLLAENIFEQRVPDVTNMFSEMVSCVNWREIPVGNGESTSCR